MTTRILNLKRAPEDPRDKKFALIAAPQLSEPRIVDLRHLDMPIWDQGSMGSCTGQSWAALHDFLRRKTLNNKGVFKPSSRLFIYNCERIGSNTLHEDSGANMRDGGDVLHDLGVCPEKMFDYKHDNLYKMPTGEMYSEAAAHKNSTYYALDTVREMRHCLQEGYPFVFGFAVPNEFMGFTMASKGRMPINDWYSDQQGGHAVMCVGYDDEKREFIVRNSWGPDWGDKGYFYMPYSIMQNAATTFNQYTLRL